MLIGMCSQDKKYRHIGDVYRAVLSFIMIMSEYEWFFKIFLYTVVAPVPLASFAEEPSQRKRITLSFLILNIYSRLSKEESAKLR